MSTELVRAVCHKPRGHTLLVVHAAPGGNHSVTLEQAVTTGPGQYEGHTFRTTMNDLEGRMAYCRSCGKPYMVNETVLRDAIARGIPRLVLEPRGFLTDPLRILRQRHAPKL